MAVNKLVIVTNFADFNGDSTIEAYCLSGAGFGCRHKTLVGPVLGAEITGLIASSSSNGRQLVV